MCIYVYLKFRIMIQDLIQYAFVNKERAEMILYNFTTLIIYKSKTS